MTEPNLSASPSVVELFEAQAGQSPKATAVVAAGETLTYGALHAESSQIARALRARGVDSRTPVGICLERSLFLPAALLGVLKAGAGYVPLAPDYPQSRRAFMLADAGVRLVVTQAALLRQVPGGIQTLCLDTDAAQIAAFNSAALPPVPADPDGLFYVIYTSGSTGTPKGVADGGAPSLPLTPRPKAPRLRLGPAPNGGPATPQRLQATGSGVIVRPDGYNPDQRPRRRGRDQRPGTGHAGRRAAVQGPCLPRLQERPGRRQD